MQSNKGGDVDDETLVPVAAHEDMEDEGQTVSYVPPTPQPAAPKTGDATNALIWVLLLAIAALGAVISVAAARRKEEKQ